MRRVGIRPKLRRHPDQAIRDDTPRYPTSTPANNTPMVLSTNAVGHMENPGKCRKTVRHESAFNWTLNPSTPTPLPMIPARRTATSPDHAANPTASTPSSGKNAHHDRARRGHTRDTAPPIRISASELIQRAGSGAQLPSTQQGDGNEWHRIADTHYSHHGVQVWPLARAAADRRVNGDSHSIGQHRSKQRESNEEPVEDTATGTRSPQPLPSIVSLKPGPPSCWCPASTHSAPSRGVPPKLVGVCPQLASGSASGLRTASATSRRSHSWTRTARVDVRRLPCQPVNPRAAQTLTNFRGRRARWSRPRRRTSHRVAVTPGVSATPCARVPHASRSRAARGWCGSRIGLGFDVSLCG